MNRSSILRSASLALVASLALSGGSVAAAGSATPVPDPEAVIPALSSVSVDPPVRTSDPWGPAPAAAPPPGPNLEPATPAAVVPAIEAAKPPPPPPTEARRPREMWTREPVRLRAGPSTDTGVVDELTVDTRVVPEPSDRRAPPEWIRVRAGGSTGWMKASYLTPRKPQARAGGGDCAPTGPDGPSPVVGGSARGVGGTVRMRAGPSCSDKTLDELEPGSTVRVTGVAGDWFAVAGQGWERVFIHRGALIPAP